MAQHLLLILSLAAALAAASATGANDSSTCDAADSHGACAPPAVKAALYTGPAATTTTAPTVASAALPLPVLPVIPAARRRTYMPAAPQGPRDDAVVDLRRPVNTSLPVKLIVRGSVGPRLADALAVQGMAPALVVPAGTELGHPAMVAALEPLQLLRNDSIVLFLDAPSDTTLLLGEWREISRKFQRSGARILLAASQKCRRGCAFDWPEVNVNEPRYLDSSAWIGYAASVAAMLGRIPPPSGSLAISDHHHLAAFFLAESDRQELGMELDSASKVFLSLTGYDDNMDAEHMDMQFEYNGVNDTRLQLKITGSYPAVIVGAGNPKLLAQINNYAPMRWLPTTGCLHCRNTTEGPLDVSVYIGVLVEPTSPFLDLALQFLANQSFDKSRTKIGIAVLPSPSYARHLAIVQDFLANHTAGLAEARLLSRNESAYEARRAVFQAANDSGATHMFYIDSTVHLMNPDALSHLLHEDRPVLAPLMTRYASAFTNVWGASDGDPDTQCADTDNNCRGWAADGECTSDSEKWMKRHCPVSCEQCVGASSNPDDLTYRRSVDYMDWATGERRGIWEVPLMHMAALYRREALVLLTNWLADKADKEANLWDLTISQTYALRAAKLPLLADNQISFGVLATLADYPHDKVNPDLFVPMHNEPLWRQKYLHPAFVGTQPLEFVQGRCWDIYNFALFSERFCSEFVAEAEAYGQWSGGAYTDKRLKGGYEPVPTRDIHFYQFGFDKAWNFMLKNYVAPVAETQWVGYKLEGKATLDFIVKYEPTGQPFLRLHHDASTFSLNVALNRIGIDFEGGGTRFPRQNCTVLSNQVGHALMHPGRLTHQHEGLYVTKGTRYIIVSFVDQV